MPEIYLDNAATYLGRNSYALGNPSSLHHKGIASAQRLVNSRIMISKVLNCRPNEIIFTSGGTESDNLAIKGLARSLEKYGKSIAIGATEHKAIINSCEALQREGFKTVVIPVDENGIIKMKDLEKILKNKDITLVSIMYANNETGVIQPIREIAKLVHEYGKVFHTDAVQAANCLSLDTQDLGVDAMSLSGHKIGAQKGIGLLYLKKGIPITPIIDGGGQEHGLRSGTENVEGIESFAYHLASISPNLYSKKCRFMKMEMLGIIEDGLENVVPIRINGLLCSLPTHISITFKGIDGEALALLLDQEGVYVSTGSACNSQSVDPSHVLTAMGLTPEDARCTIRISLSDCLTVSDIENASNIIVKCVKYLEEMKKCEN
jgi:cysteine desulfurase